MCLLSPQAVLVRKLRLAGKQVLSGRVPFGHLPGLMSAQSSGSVFRLLIGTGWPCAAFSPDFPPMGHGRGQPKVASCGASWAAGQAGASPRSPPSLDSRRQLRPSQGATRPPKWFWRTQC